MKDSELTRRVVGILTQTYEWRRLLREDPDRTDLGTEGAVADLIYDMVPTRFEFDEDATPAEVAQAMGDQIYPAIREIAGTFAAVFAELAEVHDRDDPETTTTDVLQQLAVRADDLDN
ncbi:hypothetical protein [Streptomyces lincolnensis]|uniref:hypothetical protein n=1 Tax=Streptomyces lincolnensis TaxID=1915 RepID=UPI0037CF2968